MQKADLHHFILDNDPSIHLQGPLCLGWSPFDQSSVSTQRAPQGDHRHRVQEEDHLLLQQPLYACRP